MVVLVFAGIFALSGHKANAPSKGSKNSTSTLTEHVEGKGKSGLKIVEYGDYQCPYCGQAYPAVKQAVSSLYDQIYFQFRNYPLTQLHQNAFAAARAAEAAGMQGKFWEMHDALYQSQDQWSSQSDPSSSFIALAQQIGLNVSKFKTDYASEQVNNLINADMAEGNKLKIQGTPAFFIDGKSVTLPYQNGAAAVEKVIKQAIADKASSSSKTDNKN